MHWLQNLQKVCILWGTQMSSRTAHIHTKPLASLPWGHQEVPAKFNFARDGSLGWHGEVNGVEKRHRVGQSG